MIIDDGSWIYGYDIDALSVSVGIWNVAEIRKTQFQPNVNVTLPGSFDAKVIVHHEHLPWGFSANQLLG